MKNVKSVSGADSTISHRISMSDPPDTKPLKFRSLTQDEYEELLYSQGLLKQVPRHAKGHRQIHRILTTTLNLLASKGYSTVTFGHLSQKLSMAKGNIQYYFPTRDALLRSVMLLDINVVEKSLFESTSTPEDDAWKRLEKVIEWQVKYSRSADRTAMLLEKRAFAARDHLANEIMNTWFDWHIEYIAKILHPLRSDLSRDDIVNLASVIVSIFESSDVFFGRRRVRKKSLVNFETTLQRTVRVLVESFKGSS